MKSILNTIVDTVDNHAYAACIEHSLYIEAYWRGECSLYTLVVAHINAKLWVRLHDITRLKNPFPGLR